MPKKITTRDDWIHLGLRRFARGGEAALGVEALSRGLKCSKSSFYHYFSTRDGFLDALVQHWCEVATEDVIRAQASRAAETPEQQLEALFHLALSQDSSMLRQIRLLAQDRPALRVQLQRIEARRLTHLRVLLVGTGHDAEIAEDKAEVLYTFMLGARERAGPGPQSFDSVQRRLDRIKRTLGL